MADELIQIADAVVKELNTSGRWSLPFEAGRLYVPETELDTFESGDMRVTVVAGGRVRETSSRGRSQVDYVIPILFQQKLLPNTDDPIAPSNEDQCDPLVELIQEVADWFDKVGSVPLETYPDAQYVRSTNEVAYDQVALQENGLFASVLTLTFRAWRPKR